MLTVEYRVILYAVALLIGLAIFAKVPSHRMRQAVLLLGSYALYATWGPWFAGVLVASTLMNFLLGQWLRRKPSALVLWIGIACDRRFFCSEAMCSTQPGGPGSRACCSPPR